LVNEDEKAFLDLYRVLRYLSLLENYLLAPYLSNLIEGYATTHDQYLSKVAPKGKEDNAPQTEVQLEELLRINKIYTTAIVSYIKLAENRVFSNTAKDRYDEMHKLFNTIDNYRASFYFKARVLNEPIGFKKACTDMQRVVERIRNSIKQNHESKSFPRGRFFSSDAVSTLNIAINQAQAKAKAFLEKHPVSDKNIELPEKNLGNK
jgi:hypothetical protein